MIDTLCLEAHAAGAAVTYSPATGWGRAEAPEPSDDAAERAVVERWHWESEGEGEA